MTVYAREIEDLVHPKNSNTVETMPKGTRHITLLYHQVRMGNTLNEKLSLITESSVSL